MGRWRYVRLSKRGRVLTWLLLIAALLAAVSIIALSHLKPVLLSLAVSRVTHVVNRVVVAAVNDAVDSGAIDYDVLITLEKDEAGRVTALRSNMSAVNALQSALADDILQRLGDVSTSELAIPVGTLSGSPLLAGRGPSIHVRMQAAGSISAGFHNEFTSAGINQTKHRILLEVDVAMGILLPGFTTSTHVKSEVAVAETVIVGSVPQTYTSFSTLPEELRQYAEDYILNGS